MLTAIARLCEDLECGVLIHPHTAALAFSCTECFLADLKELTNPLRDNNAGAEPWSAAADVMEPSPDPCRTSVTRHSEHWRKPSDFVAQRLVNAVGVWSVTSGSAVKPRSGEGDTAPEDGTVGPPRGLWVCVLPWALAALRVKHLSSHGLQGPSGLLTRGPTPK